MDVGVTEVWFDALRDAVRVARDRQITNLRTLRRVLKGMGYSDETIAEALIAWGQALRRVG